MVGHLTCLAFDPLFVFQIESNEDVLWKPKVRETKEDMANRGLDFLNW